MIVVDTNVVAYLWLPAEQTPAAERLLDVDPDWKVPFLWRSELRSVLALAVKRKRCSLSEAIDIAQRAHDHLKGRELAVESDEVLRLADVSGCSAYDCEFVSLARRLRVPLVTNDHQVLKAFPAIAVALEKYAPGH